MVHITRNRDESALSGTHLYDLLTLEKPVKADFLWAYPVYSFLYSVCGSDVVVREQTTRLRSAVDSSRNQCQSRRHAGNR